MAKQFQIVKLQVFSNGHFRSIKDTPWQDIEKTPAFKHVMPFAAKGEIVKVHGREFRVVG